MNTEELKKIIWLYFDGELENNKEPLLFTSLSQDSDARDYFKAISFLQNAVLETEKEFPQELETRIFYSLKGKEKEPHKFYNKGLVRILSYSFIILLIVINIYLLGRVDSYSEKVNAVEKVVEKQNYLIELLYNSLPPTEIKATWDNEITIKAKL